MVGGLRFGSELVDTGDLKELRSLLEGWCA